MYSFRVRSTSLATITSVVCGTGLRIYASSTSSSVGGSASTSSPGSSAAALPRRFGFRIFSALSTVTTRRSDIIGRVLAASTMAAGVTPRSPA